MNILERYTAMEYGPAPESRSEADRWIAGRDFSQALFIDGKWKKSSSGKSFKVVEPSSGKTLAEVAEATAADVDAAVAAATRAAAKWKNAGGYERALSGARDAAVEDMIEAAKEMGANGIVGLDFDYEVLGETNGMLMVAVSGTAVRRA